MTLGIGLGAFTEGLEAGYGLRQKIDAGRRAKKNRDALDQIDTDARTQYDAAVADGSQKVGSYEQFWLQYALPKRRMEMIKQGDYAGARALSEWGESDAALRGGKLFSSAMLKAQTGDAAGALEDAIQAGQVKGYIDHGYELAGQEEIKDEAGNVLGYRLNVKDQNGKTFQQDIAIADIPKVVSVFANPDAAWQSQVAAQQRQKERKEDLEDFTKKEKVKADLKTTDHTKAYTDARKARLENDLSFADLSPEEQDAVVRKDLEAAESYANSKKGTPSASAAPAEPSSKRIIVDEATGEPIQQQPQRAITPSQIAGQKPAGLSGQAIERRPLPDPSVVAGIPPASQQQGAARVSEQPVGTMERRAAIQRQQLLSSAATAIRQGEDPAKVAAKLRAAGLSERELSELARP